MLLALAGAALLWAHGGGMDAQGGHNDRKAGNYHFHRGPLAGKASSSKEDATRALRSGGSNRTEDDTPESQGSFTCGDKRTCSQMSSCEEARFYLNQCGLYGLDGDMDGTPCESLCK